MEIQYPLSEGSKEEGRPAPMQGRPSRLQGATGCDQGPLQGGGRPRPKPLVRAAASMRGHPRAWLAPAGIGNARDQATGGGCPL
ncbi:hypothetical protein BHE74_00037756 [Ensete ventricosum]|nr:hypothetical protein BHE74_00037756 [Ensete ventricosum]